MKRIPIVVFFLAACAGPGAPPAVVSISLPSGAALEPWDPAHPGLARPLGIALLDGKAWVALGNYDAGFAPRGPGLLASFVPPDGHISLVDLGGAAARECISAGWVHPRTLHHHRRCQRQLRLSGRQSDP